MLADVQRQRRVELDGVTNLRNLGGYHTMDGTKTVKWGVAYRSDQLSDIPADLAQRVLVEQLHIRHTYDLRADAEVRAKSYDIQSIQRWAVPIDPSEAQRLVQPVPGASDAEEMNRLMQEVYREFVRTHAATIGSVIKGIVNRSTSADNAALIHCTAGKDRTGWSCYVLLSLLGVTEEEKRADYLLTNRYFRVPTGVETGERYEMLSEEAMAVLWTVRDEFLDAALDEVNALGGVEAYAMSHMGVTEAELQKLREMFLE